MDEFRTGVFLMDTGIGSYPIMQHVSVIKVKLQCEIQNQLT